MNWQVLINGKQYPMIVEPVRYMCGSDWMSTYVVQIDQETSARIDSDLGEDMSGFVADCIHYALIDGWTSSGVFDEDDKPIHWQILMNGKPVNREQIESILN